MDVVEKFDLDNFTFEELKALEVAIKNIKATKRIESKEASKEDKEDRVTKFKAALGEGDVISFLYGRKNDLFEGEVVRASEKSVTVSSVAFAEEGSEEVGNGYVKYDRIESLISKGTNEEVTAEDLLKAM